MKYEINLLSGKKGWAFSLIRTGESLRSFFTSLAFLISILVGLLLLTIYISIVIPAHRLPPVQRAEIRDLTLSLHNLKEEKNILFNRANSLLQLKEVGIHWQEKLVSLGKAVTGDIWLTRIVFKEEKVNVVPFQKRAGQATNKTVKNKILTIEGATSAKYGQPQIGIVARLIDSLNNDPSFSAHFENVEIKGIKAYKKDSKITNFLLKASLKEDTSMKAVTFGYETASK